MWYNCFLKRTKLIREIPLTSSNIQDLCGVMTDVNEVSTDNDIH